MLESDQCFFLMLRCPLSSYFTAYSLYIYIYLVHPHNTMNPRPQPSISSESAGRLRESQPSSEDDLLAVRVQDLRPGLSPVLPPEAESPEDRSPPATPSAHLARSRSLHASVRIHNLPSDDDLLPRSSPSALDELIHTMPQYQPVSAGSTSNPRTMSQVSPGFIFVNFLSQSICCFIFPVQTLPLVPGGGTFFIMSPISCLLCYKMITRTLNASSGSH